MGRWLLTVAGGSRAVEFRAVFFHAQIYERLVLLFVVRVERAHRRLPTAAVAAVVDFVDVSVNDEVLTTNVK